MSLWRPGRACTKPGHVRYTAEAKQIQSMAVRDGSDFKLENRTSRNGLLCPDSRSEEVCCPDRHVSEPAPFLTLRRRTLLGIRIGLVSRRRNQDFRRAGGAWGTGRSFSAVTAGLITPAPCSERTLKMRPEVFRDVTHRLVPGVSRSNWAHRSPG